VVGNRARHRFRTELATKSPKLAAAGPRLRSISIRHAGAPGLHSRRLSGIRFQVGGGQQVSSVCRPARSLVLLHPTAHQTTSACRAFEPAIGAGRSCATSSGWLDLPKPLQQYFRGDRATPRQDPSASVMGQPAGGQRWGRPGHGAREDPVLPVRQSPGNQGPPAGLERWEVPMLQSQTGS